MKTQKSSRLLRVFATLMVLLLLLCTPLLASAEDTDDEAQGIKVYMTVSNKGILAAAKDGTAMVEKEITVTDLNQDGILSYDEALVATHENYCQEGTAGYSGGPWISKLWGQSTTNTLMFANDISISPTTVDAFEVKADDKLYVSINADNTYYADWFSAFDLKEKTIEAGKSVTLNLKGYMGMTEDAEELKGLPLEGITIGTWQDGAFQALEGVTTDADGNATITMDKAGTYIVTAQGTVKDMVTVDWTTYEQMEADCPIMAPYCILTVTKSLASAQISVASATYTGKNLTPAVTVKVDGVTLVKDTDYTLTYSNNKNAGSSAKVTVTGKGVYLDTASKTFTINKAKQPMVVKTKTKTLKAKALKKKKKVYKALVASKNQGAVSYKVTYKNKKSKKALKFTKGKITVKKGTKKGTYVVKVVVTAKGSANYLKGSVTKNIKVKVK